MGKYTNAWFYQKTYSNNHDCANDGTCGQSIRNFNVSNSNIFFYDDYGRVIAQMPRLPGATPSKYYNNLYKSADSRTFHREPEYIKEVLSNDFVFEHESVRYVINYDNMSQQEQEQVRTDIKNAYDAYKTKFCISKLEDKPIVQIYIFNNKSDLQHIRLIPEFRNEQRNFLGITNGQKVLCYKASDMDNTLAHELGHVFQFRFSTAKVKALDRQDIQLMANAIGQEVEEKNHKVILEQKGVDEYKEFYGGFEFKYRNVTYNIFHRNLSEEEKDQMMQDIKNSHELLISEYHKLSQNRNTTIVISIDIDEDKNIEDIYCQKPGELFSSIPLDKDLISKSKSKEEVEESHEVEQTSQEEEPSEIESGKFEFEYKGSIYYICHKNLLEEEKDQIMQDIKSSHESLISEYHTSEYNRSLQGIPPNKNAVVIMVFVAEDKSISIFYSINEGMILIPLDKDLISKSKEEVEESHEVEQTSQEEEPDDQVDGSNYEENSQESELNNDEKETEAEEKNSQQEITSTDSFVDILIKPFSLFASFCSGFMSWLFGSNEEETEEPAQLSHNDLSLLKLDKLVENDQPNYADNYLSYDYPHSSNDLL